MRILHVSSLIEAIGATPLGGTEQFVVDLSGRQARAEHEVSVIAVNGSHLRDGVNLIDLGFTPGTISPLRTSLDKPCMIPQAELTERLKQEGRIFETIASFLDASRKNFDVIHNHSYEHFSLVRLAELEFPLVQTLHLPPNYPWISEALATSAAHPHVSFVTVSHAMKSLYERHAGMSPRVIPNWIDCSELPFSNTAGEGLLWAGRISPEKGLKEAIEIARGANRQLTVVGPVYDRDYFASLEQELTVEGVSYLGPQPHEKVLSLMREAAAIVSPISWDEPFGLIFLESLACGTPVLAFRRGATEEIIVHKKTGYLGENTKELISFANKIDLIKRADCREDVEKRFNPASSVREYLEAYQSVAGLKSDTEVV